MKMRWRQRPLAFFSDGIAVGQPALVIATPSHSARIIAGLKSGGLDVNELRRTGELNVFDAQKMLSSFMVGGTPDPLLFKSNMGDVIERLCVDRNPCPIRAYGEMVDVLWQAGNADGAIRLEILWNQLASTYEFSLLCGYAVGHFYKETSGSGVSRIVCNCYTSHHVLPRKRGPSEPLGNPEPTMPLRRAGARTVAEQDRCGASEPSSEARPLERSYHCSVRDSPAAWPSGICYWGCLIAITALSPPKPKEFDKAARIGSSRGWFGT